MRKSNEEEREQWGPEIKMKGKGIEENIGLNNFKVLTTNKMTTRDIFLVYNICLEATMFNVQDRKSLFRVGRIMLRYN